MVAAAVGEEGEEGIVVVEQASSIVDRSPLPGPGEFDSPPYLAIDQPSTADEGQPLSESLTQRFASETNCGRYSDHQKGH